LKTDSFNFRIAVMAVLVAMLSATAGAAFWKLSQARANPIREALIVLPEPRVIADFALVDQHGQSFSLDELRGNWSLIFFGFTHCPDVCPTALYELQQVKDILSQDSRSSIESPEVLFISVDPERDSAEKLDQYLAHFDSTFIGLTGEHEQLMPLTRQLGIAYRIEDHASGAEQYTVDHSSGILLINPSGQLHGVFPAPHIAEKIAADLHTAIKQAGS
jgi:protein SCO1/2